jgi:hypothetical protein
MFARAILIAVLMSPLTAKAITVGGDGLSAPFDIQLDADQRQATSLTLAITNSGTLPANIISWQFGLKLLPIDGAQGTLAFSIIGAPLDSLFGEVPGPDVLGLLPSDDITAFDLDYTGSLDGIPILPAHTTNAITLSLSKSPDARGSFALVLADTSLPSLDSQSFWYSSDSLDPLPFDNDTPSALGGYSLLGTIHVGSAITGDYDGDGKVTSNDWCRWRALFGNSVAAGESADGNGDGTIDAADYVVWRTASVSVPNDSASVHSSVPEPRVSVLIFALATIICSRHISRAGNLKNSRR